MVEVRPLLPTDVFAVMADLRDADRDEITALVGAEGVTDAIGSSVSSSARSWTLTDNGHPIAVFGVAPSDMPGVGVPWLVGTPGILRRRRSFMRLCAAYIPLMHTLFPVLCNIVDARNTRAIAWLHHAGFTFGPPSNVGIEGRLFYPFSRAVPCA